MEQIDCVDLNGLSLSIETKNKERMLEEWMFEWLLWKVP